MLPADQSNVWDIADKALAVVMPKSKEPVASPLDYRAEADAESFTDHTISVHEDEMHVFHQQPREQQAREYEPTDIGWGTATIEVPEIRHGSDYAKASFNIQSESDEITQLQAILEDRLDAMEFKLEPWGTGGNLFRCSCYVALSNNTAIAKKHFQTLDSDPIKAVQNLIDEIQTWKAATP